MKIFKFHQYIKEGLSDTPENYIDSALRKLKNKIDSFFGEESNTVKTIDNSNMDREKLSFKDMNVNLESSEISKYSKLQDCLKIKFSDEEFLYDLTIAIDLKEAVPTEDNDEFSMDDIENCFIRFKKYEVGNFDLIGQLTKNIKIKDIDEDFLIKIKMELDGLLGEEDEEEFKIETE